MKHAVIIFLLVTSGVLCQAQDRRTNNTKAGRPDFSGTWQLDRLKSKLDPKSDAVSDAITLTITHHEPELRIVQTTDSRGKKRNKEVCYHTDGRWETNAAVWTYLMSFNGSDLANRDPDQVPSKSEWRGRKLRIQSAVVVFIPDGKQSTIKTEQVWELAADGQTLIQSISFSVERGEPVHFRQSKLKKVFHRVPTS